MNNALQDIYNSLYRLPAAFYFAWTDTKARYRRTIMGPLWLTFGTAIGVAGLGLLWSEILKIDKKTFIPSLTVGLVVWQFINGCITESSSTFIRNAHLIRNMKVPFSFFSMQLIIRQLVNFSHNFIIIICVLFIFNVPVSFYHFLYALIGFVLVALNLLWLGLLIAIIGARYRDIDPLITGFMPLIFFLSPVIYRPDNLGNFSSIIWLNPFTYLISIVRDPLLGYDPDINMYLFSFAILLIGWLITIRVLSYKHSRISFWV